MNLFVCLVQSHTREASLTERRGCPHRGNPIRSRTPSLCELRKGDCFSGMSQWVTLLFLLVAELIFAPVLICPEGPKFRTITTFWLHGFWYLTPSRQAFIMSFVKGNSNHLSACENTNVPSEAPSREPPNACSFSSPHYSPCKSVWVLPLSPSVSPSAKWGGWFWGSQSPTGAGFI